MATACKLNIIYQDTLDDRWTTTPPSSAEIEATLDEVLAEMAGSTPVVAADDVRLIADISIFQAFSYSLQFIGLTAGGVPTTLENFSTAVDALSDALKNCTHTNATESGQTPAQIRVEKA